MEDDEKLQTGCSDKLSSQFYDQQIKVSFEYPVFFTNRVFGRNNITLEIALNRLKENRRHRLIVFLDDGVANAHPRITEKIEEYFNLKSDRFELVNKVHVLPGGKTSKTDLRIVKKVVNMLGDLHLDRQSFVIVAGGGSLLDAVGFAASLVHRGLRLVRIPTTTLAQADAGIGIKNGLDTANTKNFLGTFAPPFAVINDFAFLETLHFKDWVGGVAEAFKVAIIRDKSFFDYLSGNTASLRQRNTAVINTVIRRCAQLHLDHTRNSGDPFELGSARPLDFGHWSGHKLEVMSGYNLGHGQAVAVGMAIDGFLAMRMGLLDESQFQKIITALTGCGLDVWNENLSKRAPNGRLIILEGLNEFREHLGGMLSITLPKSIGSMIEVHDINFSFIEQAVKYLEHNFAGEHGQA